MSLPQKAWNGKVINSMGLWWPAAGFTGRQAGCPSWFSMINPAGEELESQLLCPDTSLDPGFLRFIYFWNQSSQFRGWGTTVIYLNPWASKP